MNLLRIIVRVILVLLMIPAILQLIPAAIAVVVTINKKPDLISRALGQFVGTLLIFLALLWMFRKLRPKGSNDD